MSAIRLPGSSREGGWDSPPEQVQERRRAWGAAPLASALGVALITAGCHQRPAALPLERSIQPSYRPQDYQRVLDRWTRYAAVTVMRELTTTLRVYATPEAPDWIEAYVAKRASAFSLSAAQAAQLRRELLEQWQEHYAFVVIVATHDLGWNDLERTPSHWRAVLRNDAGLQVDPVEVKSLRRLTAVERAFFPQIDAFYRLYYVKFPRRLENGRQLVGAPAEQLVLRIAGPLGQAELVWRLR